MKEREEELSEQADIERADREHADREQRIAELTASVRSLLTNMPALTFSKDVEHGRYLACNQMFAEYANKSRPEEVVGLTDFEIFDEVTARHFVEDDKKALSMDEPYVFFEDVPDAAGVQKQFQTTKLKFTDETGRLCMLGMCVDVTEMMTIKRKNDEILLQKEIADAKNRSKSTFLSNMSHEIRTPITAILGMNEMIRRESNDPVILGYADNIEKAGLSLLGIISDILDFSKIEAGRMEVVEEPYQPLHIVADMYNLISLRAESKGLSLKFHIDSSLPKGLVGDELRIKQILMNLLSNAVKYTEKGSVSLTVKGNVIDDTTIDVNVSVEDTGIGIHHEEMEHLFSAFDRLDVKRTRNIEGTGLGLAITSQMLELMNAELRVESEYNKGSIFSFTLRQRICDAAPVGDIDVKEYASKEAGYKETRKYFTAPGKKILLVDDTPMNLQVIAGLLKRTKLDIDTAQSGRECISMFGERDYDIVFMDYRMPDLDGIETLGRLKEMYPEKCGKTPVISLTASAISGDREKMLSAGFTDYLTKPVNISEMEDMLVRYLPEGAVQFGEEDVSEDVSLADRIPQVLFSTPLIDPEKGIEYCGEVEDYMDAVEIYLNSISKKAGLIEQSLSDGDIEAFTIQVHSLKSMSKAIGAETIFERAFALEQAGRNHDVITLKKDTPAFLQDYRSLIPVLKEACNTD